MLRKKIKTYIIAVIIGTLCFVGYKIISMVTYKNNISETLKTIPEFSFQTLNRNNYSNKDIRTDLNTIFIYFNSDCEFCHSEAKAISQNIEFFKKSQLIFVSSEKREIIRNFSANHQLDKNDQVIFLYDVKDEFSKRFDATSIPYILIYDEYQRLIKRHKGQLSIDYLLEIVNE